MDRDDRWRDHLVGEYRKAVDPKILHFTVGGPWFPEYSDVDYADLWRKEAASMFALNRR